jgi:hypothetical protein
LCVFKIFVNHGGRWGDRVQALAQWRHLVASSEAQDVLNWAMHPTLYRRICMMIEITSIFPALFVVIDSVLAHNHRLWPCYGHNKLKPSYHIVIIDVINLSVYYGRPPSTIHAVSATIFDGGQAIHQKLE